MATGETVWVSESGDYPLLMADERLLTQVDGKAGQLRLVSLGLDRQAEPLGQIDVELPEGVVATVDDTAIRSFDVEARATDDGIFLAWTERVQPVAAVERLQKEAAIRSGIGRIDMEEESYEPVNEADVRKAFAEPPPDLTDSERLKGVEGVQFRSADGRFVLISELVADNRVWENYQWTIWSRDTGEKVGSFRSFLRLSAFAVMGDVLLQEIPPHQRISGDQAIATPLSMRAIALDRGEEIWSRAIRDTQFTGVLPP